MGKTLASIAYLVAIVAGGFQIYGHLADWGYVRRPQGPYAVQTPVAPQPTTPPARMEEPTPPPSAVAVTPPAQSEPTVTPQTPTARKTDGSVTRSTARGSLRSIRGDVPTRIEFVNESGRPVRVFWLDYEGREKCYFGLAPGDSLIQRTYATHPWRVRDAFSGKVLEEVVAGEDTREVAIRLRSLELPVIWPIGMPVTCAKTAF